jgi:hypothetical protein
MSRQSLGIGEPNGGRTELLHSGLRIFLNGYELYEVEHAEAAADAREPAGGQRVVGAGDVVAQRL